MTHTAQTSRSIWPIRADHMTSDGRILGLEGQGIITNRELQGHQTEICYEVGYPTTIIEFALDGTPIRTDSPFLNRAMHPACRVFRKTNLHTEESGELKVDKKNKLIPGALCFHCDQCHAQLLYKLDEADLTPAVINRRRVNDSRLRALYDTAVDCRFEPRLKDGRLYLEYDCPLLGFRELVFPIVFEKRVIAVFFVGQLTLKGQESFIETMMSSVDKRWARCPAHTSGLRVDKNVTKRLVDEQKKWLSDLNAEEDRCITDGAYAEIIDRAIEEIVDFENRLVESFSHRRHEYIRESIVYASEMKEFAKSARLSQKREAEDVVDDTPLDDLWRECARSLDHLVSCFSLSYALAFGPSRIINTEQDFITVQASAGKWEEFFSKATLDDLKIAIREVSKDEGYIVCSPTQEGNQKCLDLLHGSDHDTLGDFQLVLLPVPQHLSSSIAILLGYGKSREVALSSLPEHAPHEYMHQTMKAFFSLAVLAVAATRARGLEELAKKQLLYLGHEAGQLSGGLDWLRKCYEDAKGLEDRLREQYPFSNSGVIKGLRKKIQDLCADIHGYTGQMSFVFDTAEQLGSSITPTVELGEFRPYGDVLAKWKDTYRQECDKKRLQMRVEFPESVKGSPSNDPWRPKMWGDRFLFEQVVYNLVNNAEKYCYRGTKIDMDCKLKSLEEDAPHVLTITNYGLCLDSAKDLVFAPFKRGKGSGDVSGLGLGLYIVRIIVEEIYKGRVEALCEDKPISPFNVPLIKPYIYRSFEGKNRELVEELREELARLEPRGPYDDIVAYEREMKRTDRGLQKTPRYRPDDDAIRDEIRKRTFKVTLRAEIPSLKKVEVTK